MKNKSVWKENVKNKELPSLDKDINCDVLIIGGGIAGLSTAYFLSHSDKDIVLIDRDKCGEGASSRNTGKLTFMQELVYHKIEKNYSEEVASLYLNSQKEAISLVLGIIEDNKIDCNLLMQDAFVFINNESERKQLIKEINFYKKNNIKLEEVDKLPINYPILYGIKADDSYSFNPYKFLVAVKKLLQNKIRIYEKTRALSVKRENDYYLVKTNNNLIKCNYVVIATQYPFFIVPYFAPFKTITEKSFIVSGKYEVRNWQAISANKPTFSFNYYDNDNEGYLIYARRSHSVTYNLDTRKDKDEIIEEYEKYFDKKPDYYFQNHDLMTYDYMPFIGKIDNYNMYVLTGFNKWGNTNGVIGGKLINDLILGKENSYAELFNPKRGLSALKIKNLVIYNTSVMSRYILNKVVSNKSFYNDNVKVEYVNGRKCGIYIDDKGEHIVSNICPHMKCNLAFNYVDKTWDCPCHASRFDIDGNVIWGPSVYDIKIDK